MLESQSHEFSAFVTLTYSDEHLQFTPNGLATLFPRHGTLFLKRLREKLGSARPVRYYWNGEYGDETQRPHYHAALFGVSSLEWDLVQTCWPYGRVDDTNRTGRLGELTFESAQYIAGYVTKKMTKHDDVRLNGRHPEYARMSLKPGIGALSVPQIADTLNSPHGARLIAESGDVPESLRHGRRSMPLGRYLRRKLREEMGFDHFGGQEKPAQEMAEEMHSLLEASGGRARYLAEKPFIDRVKIRQVEGRAEIWSKKGKI